jgi:SWI/SNF-related matrix-associated actin-dependent regulator 1 of chromatin subfamily A
MLCKRRIMLTGTPLQNDLGELAGLLAFLLPDIITSYEELEDEVRIVNAHTRTHARTRSLHSS